MTVARRLIFVYNADSGLFNLLADMAHKMFSPSTYGCVLCTLTHSPFAMRSEWRAFLDEIAVEVRFLHRDEWLRLQPDQVIPLPAVLCETDAGILVCLDAAALRRCESLVELKALITANCLRDLP